MTDVVGNPEEERRAEFYHEPWSQEAVSRYFYCKVRRGCSCTHGLSGYGQHGPSCWQAVTLIFRAMQLPLFILQIQQRRQELEQSLGVRNT